FVPEGAGTSTFHEVGGARIVDDGRVATPDVQFGLSAEGADDVHGTVQLAVQRVADVIVEVPQGALEGDVFGDHVVGDAAGDPADREDGGVRRRDAAGDCVLAG